MEELVSVMTDPTTLLMLVGAIGVLATVVMFVLPTLSRDRLPARMRMMAVERDKMRATRMAELSKRDGKPTLRRTPATFMLDIVDQLNLRSAFDTEEVREKLKMAGLRGQGPLVTYMVFRVAMPIVVCIGTLIYMFFIADYEYPPIVKIGIGIAAGYVGFYLPNVFINNLVAKRQDSIKNAFPDALDMLLICVQSGMSVESAFGKVKDEIGVQSLELAEELALTSAELSYLSDRRQAFENLGKRTGLPGIKAVGTALIQAERYGTPVGQALRTMAQENREARMAEAEKKAAALPPKLTVPMIIFFLPVLFVVIMGPAMIQIFQWD